MAKEKTAGDEDVINVSLKYAKDTKGTYVYQMSVGGEEIGGIYLKKSIFKAKPGERLAMRIVPAE